MKPEPETPSAASASNILEVENLSITFNREGRIFRPVRDVSFSIPQKGRVALVGESGCGKSLTALAVTGLPPVNMAATGGSIRLYGKAAYVFQSPSDTLNPVVKIYNQIAEAMPRGVSRREARKEAENLAAKVGVPVRALDSYPCELSGGQLQRCILAMALAARPELLIADEPTTALDVTTQQQVLDLIENLASETGMAVLLITHNLGLVAKRMDTVHVMYAGTIVESGPVADVLSRPSHPYTQGLLDAIPSLDAPRNAALKDIPGTVPQPDAWPDGCAFAPRCPKAMPVCRKTNPGQRKCFASSPPAQ